MYKLVDHQHRLGKSFWRAMTKTPQEHKHVLFGGCGQGAETSARQVRDSTPSGLDE